jgi:hypothetical protein
MIARNVLLWILTLFFALSLLLIDDTHYKPVSTSDPPAATDHE